VERITAADAAFLDMEHPVVLVHLTGVSVRDASRDRDRPLHRS